MRVSRMSERARRWSVIWLTLLMSGGLSAGCGSDEDQRHLDPTFRSSNNCLYRVVDHNLSTSGPLRLDGGDPVTVELQRRREVVDIMATTLDNTGKTPLTLVNVCLVPKIGRCILDFVRAKVSTEADARRSAPSRPHETWESARSYTVDGGGDSAPVLVTSVGLAVGDNKRHLCTGGAGGLGIVYRVDGVNRYAEAPIDWTVEVKPRPKPSKKHGPKRP